MALLMRAELARPGHAVPVATSSTTSCSPCTARSCCCSSRRRSCSAFANYIVPLQIGAPDVAFPRLNAFSYWLYLFGGAHRRVRASSPRAAPPTSAGSPTRRCQTSANSPGVGGDLWIIGLVVSGLGTILGAVNMITTIVCLRAPGMTMFRMPIFTWNILVTALLVLIAFPILTAALLGAGGRPAPRRARVRPGQRRRDPLAAPVLVLRPPRGLHRRAAVLRHHHRGHPGVQPQAAVRLQGPGLRDARRSPRCRWRCGRTTCSPPARCCCRSSRFTDAS